MRGRHNGYVVIGQQVKQAAVRRYLTTDISQQALAEELGVGSTTVCDWVKRYRLQGMKKTNEEEGARSTQQRSAEERLRLLLEARSIEEPELGEFLRREGIREDDLERWEQDALGGLRGGTSAADKRRLKQLESEGKRQGKRLREAEALLELQKKVQALWGDEEDDTPESND